MAKPNPDDEPTKKQARQDLEKLLESVKTAPELGKYFKTRDSNLEANMTTYETLWTLFTPKSKVVTKLFLNALQIFEVAAAPDSYEGVAPGKLYVLAWCWDWNGKEMIKAYYWLGITKFRGTKEINQLSCYPVEYYRDRSEAAKEELFKTMKARGDRYSRIVRSKPGATQMYDYKGEVLSERPSVISAGDDGSVRVFG